MQRFALIAACLLATTAVAQSTTIDAVPDHQVGDPAFLVNASSTVAGPISFQSNAPRICSVTGAGSNQASVSVASPGTCSVVACSAPVCSAPNNCTSYCATRDFSVTQLFGSGSVAPEVKADARVDLDGGYDVDFASYAGVPDILWRAPDGAVSVSFGNQVFNPDMPTSFGDPQSFVGPGSGMTPALVADFDGDGKTDIVWLHGDGQVDLWLMNGTAVRSSRVLLGPGTGWVPKLTGDFNGDAKADILWEHADGRAAIWLMDGLFPIGSGYLIPAATGWKAALVGDFNHDRKADIVWTHPDGRAALWLMDGATQGPSALLIPAGTGWAPSLLADFDGDVKADILWRHADGRTAIWLMDGITMKAGRVVLDAGTGWTAVRAGPWDSVAGDDIVWQKDDGAIAVWMMSGTQVVGGTRFATAAAGMDFKVVKLLFSATLQHGSILIRRSDGLTRLLDGSHDGMQTNTRYIASPTGAVATP